MSSDYVSLIDPSDENHLDESFFEDVRSQLLQPKRLFHEFNLNNLDELSADLRSISIVIFFKLLDFQNSLAETSASLTAVEKEDVAMLHPQVIQYPRGGGWFEDHAHPFHPQKFGLILGLTWKEAFSMGGTFFDIGAIRVYVGTEQDAGDLTLFKHDLRHGVSPVDEFANELGFGEAKGRWVAVLPYYRQTQVG